MSQYKVGDVAALFSKPKEPTTESGKKLQSLFKEFHGKNKKDKSSSQITQKGVNDLNQGSEKAENQRVTKNKKRKFTSITNEESDEVSNIKKFKKLKKKDANSTELKEKHISTELKEKHISTELKEKHISTEQDFPRRKKSFKTNKNNLNNKGFNSFEEDETALSNDKKEASGVNFKSKSKSIDKKEIFKFIKKLKQESQVAMNGINESSDNEMIPDKDEYVTGTLFEEDNEELVEQGTKKQKKKRHSNDNFVPERKLSHPSRNDNFENKISQPKIPERAAPDFIKIPGLGLEDEEDKLRRTLFVGNLPVNINRKAIKTLFSSFGQVEDVRYHGIETDKAKIFNENGSQTLNAKNYAADSVPGFVVFCYREDAVKALALSGSIFKGRHITVDFALPAGTRKLYDDKRSIFIGNLPFNCQDESVWEAFAQCGRIENVRIVRDKKTGIGKGFGYVQFCTVQSKENALELNELDIQGRTIRIKPVDSNHTNTKKAKNPPPVKGDSFRSRAFRIKKKNRDSTSRKSVKKIMKKEKNLHNKKKVANILQKAMKV